MSRQARNSGFFPPLSEDILTRTHLNLGLASGTSSGSTAHHSLQLRSLAKSSFVIRGLGRKGLSEPLHQLTKADSPVRTTSINYFGRITRHERELLCPKRFHALTMLGLYDRTRSEQEGSKIPSKKPGIRSEADQASHSTSPRTGCTTLRSCLFPSDLLVYIVKIKKRTTL